MGECQSTKGETPLKHIQDVEQKALSGEHVVDCFVCKHHRRGPPDSWIVECDAPTDKRNHFHNAARSCSFFTFDRAAVLQYRQVGRDRQETPEQVAQHPSKTCVHEPISGKEEIRSSPVKEEVLHIGMNIQHAMFGRGVVKSIEGVGEHQKVIVNFHSGGPKRLLVKFAGLEPAHDPPAETISEAPSNTFVPYDDVETAGDAISLPVEHPAEPEIPSDLYAGDRDKEEVEKVVYVLDNYDLVKASIKEIVDDTDKSFDYSKWNNCKNSIKNSSTCVECCQKRFYAGFPIEYKCTNFLKMYVMRYLPVHFFENYLAFCQIPQEIFNRIENYEKVRLLSLGGGPGSDIVAFMKYLEGKKSGKISALEVVRVDLEESWNEIAAKIINSSKYYGIDVANYRVNANVLSDFVDQSRKYNFISMSYILSEITEDMNKLARNILFSVSNPTAIIINDRDEPEVRNKIDCLLREIGVNSDCVFMCKNRQHCGITYDEEIREKVRPKLMTNSIRYTAIVNL